MTRKGISSHDAARNFYEYRALAMSKSTLGCFKDETNRYLSKRRMITSQLVVGLGLPWCSMRIDRSNSMESGGND
jgi:hypothetical protein